MVASPSVCVALARQMFPVLGVRHDGSACSMLTQGALLFGSGSAGIGISKRHSQREAVNVALGLNGPLQVSGGGGESDRRWE